MTAAQLLSPVVGTFGVVMGIAPLLQVLRVVRRGSSDDVAAGPLAIAAIGTALWLSYGLAAGDTALVIANIVATSVNTVALATVLRFRSSRRRALQAAPEPTPA
jgi:MtN3 and saliva related transmembrane protein